MLTLNIRKISNFVECEAQARFRKTKIQALFTE